MNQDKEKKIKVLSLDEVLKTAKPCYYRTALRDGNGDVVSVNGYAVYSDWTPGHFLGFIIEWGKANLNEAIIYDDKPGIFHRLCVTTQVKICQE